MGLRCVKDSVLVIIVTPPYPHVHICTEMHMLLYSYVCACMYVQTHTEGKWGFEDPRCEYASPAAYDGMLFQQISSCPRLVLIWAWKGYLICLKMNNTDCSVRMLAFLAQSSIYLLCEELLRYSDTYYVLLKPFGMILEEITFLD